MPERLAEVVAQIGNVRQLEAVVTAMRGMAAARAQQAHALLPAIDSYSAVVAQAMGQALALLGEDESFAARQTRRRAGLILFCAEQGFAGAFSEHILETIRSDGGSHPTPACIFILGTRGAMIARERGIACNWSAAMATQAGAVSEVANKIADALYQSVTAGRVTDLDVVYPEVVPGHGIEIRRRSLLPLDLNQFAPQNTSLPPLTSLAPADLVESLAVEYVFAHLCNAAMHAFAAENEARMAAMTAAKTHIEEKLADLTSRERQLRQEEITTEIVELAAGAEALARR